MHLLHMRPDELKRYTEADIPLVIPVGVVEYHGPHLPIGTDVLMTSKLCEELARRGVCVLAPAFPFGPTMNWAGGALEGDMDFAPEPLFMYVREALKGYLAMGFRRIYMMHHHAGPEGLQALCLKRAAAELMRETAREWEAGWGRSEPRCWPEPGLFGRIVVAGLDAFSSYGSEHTERLPLDHAGKGETQWMLAAYPKLVRMDLLGGDERPSASWLDAADRADRTEGERWIEFCLNGWLRELERR